MQWSLHFKTAIQPEKNVDLNLEVVLKWRDIYIGNITKVTMMAGVNNRGNYKMESQRNTLMWSQTLIYPVIAIPAN